MGDGDAQQGGVQGGGHLQGPGQEGGVQAQEVKWWGEGKEEMELAQQREVSTVKNTEGEYMPKELK